MRKWDSLPERMQCDEVRPYYEILKKKRISLKIKRLFDILLSFVLIVILFPLMLALSVWIKNDSEGPVFFRQERVTAYGKKFRIFKFRTMIYNAEKLGSQVTSENDNRITKVGSKIRKYRLDELPQLFNIFLGEMTFVGTRPEVTKYVELYTSEMLATLLLPAGVTSRASIEYKDEDILLGNAVSADDIYINKILPEKMRYNLSEIENFSLMGDVRIMLATLVAVVK